jgi:predicted RNase H-like HicB family nuclease
MNGGLDELAVKMFDEGNYSMKLTGKFDGSDGWSLKILEFPGCVGFCEKIEDARTTMRELAISWLTTALAVGYRIPEPGNMNASIDNMPVPSCLMCEGSGIIETMREGDDALYPTECPEGCPIPRPES